MTSPFQRALITLPLSPSQKEILNQRYVPLVNHLKARTFRVSILFHTSRVIVTVGSLIVPALLSIQYSQTSELKWNSDIYWVAWTISLFVTICNGLLTLFKLDKRYYYLHTVVEQLISEGWEYVELSGRFSGFYTPNTAPTHENQFVFFCHAIEKLRMRQIQEEYYKLTDSSAQEIKQIKGQEQSNAFSVDGLIPPTPLRFDLSKIPKELYDLIRQNESSRVQVGDGAAASSGAAGKEKGAKTNTKENNENGEAGSVSMLMELQTESP
jgi:hypothetical protein